MRFDESATLHTAQGAHALSVKTARGFWSGFRGLMLARPLSMSPKPQALLLLRCPSVHGFFMRCALDVVYLGGSGQGPGRYVVTHVARLKPWGVSMGKRWILTTETNGRASASVVRSQHALEMPAGSIDALGIAPGDRLDRVHAAGPHPLEGGET